MFVFVRRPEDSLPARVRASDGPGDLPASVYLGEGVLPTDANSAYSCGRLFLAGLCFWGRWVRGGFLLSRNVVLKIQEDSMGGVGIGNGSAYLLPVLFPHLISLVSHEGGPHSVVVVNVDCRSC